MAMLDREYTLLRERLDPTRDAQTQFFVFADTVSARNYSGTNECHGWIGVRFETQPRGEPSDVLLHVNLLDSTNLSQQQAIGLLGVNLLYAAFYRRESRRSLLEAIFAGLTLERMEVDVVELRGPAFPEQEPQGLGLRLVQDGLAQAVLYGADGTLKPPSEVLRKRPIVLERGMFESVLPLHRQMLEDGCARLLQEAPCEREPLPIPELSVRPVAAAHTPDEDETRRRLGEVFALESPVLLTRFPEIYHLTSYLRRYTQEPIRFVLGASNLVRVLHSAHYENLVGGLLEAMGRLFGDSVKIYVHPMETETFHRLLDAASVPIPSVVDDGSGFVGAASLRFEPPIGHLYDYLLESGWVARGGPPTGGSEAG